MRNNLKNRYTEPELVDFLEEATCFDPRKKASSPEEAWSRIESALAAQPINVSDPQPPLEKKPCILDEIFSDEDQLSASNPTNDV